MAKIHVEARYVAQVEKEYYRWDHARRGTGYVVAKGGPYPDGSVFSDLPDAFVDEIEGSGIPVKRLASQ